MPGWGTNFPGEPNPDPIRLTAARPRMADAASSNAAGPRDAVQAQAAAKHRQDEWMQSRSPAKLRSGSNATAKHRSFVRHLGIPDPKGGFENGKSSQKPDNKSKGQAAKGHASR